MKNIELIYVNENLKNIIERAGRLCYKSENKISIENNSADKFIKAIVKSKHESVIEHSNLLFKVSNKSIVKSFLFYCQELTYCKCKNEEYIIGGNVRAWKNLIRNIENDREIETYDNVFFELIAYMSLLPKCLFEDFYSRNLLSLVKEHDIKNNFNINSVMYNNNSTKLFVNSGNSNHGNCDIEIINCDLGQVEMRQTFCNLHNVREKELIKVLTLTTFETKARIITQQDVRHRKNSSYSQESQRYVNYSKKKDKEDNVIQNIKENLLEYLPFDTNYTIKNNNGTEFTIDNLIENIATTYNTLVNAYKIRPEDARMIFTNSAKSTIAITRTLPSWKNYFDLRCDKNHAQHQIYDTSVAIMETCQDRFGIFNDSIKK